MQFYFAPMEGVTGYIYRNAHAAFFPHIDKYFSPFIVANQHEGFKSKEMNDVIPEHNEGINLVPQLLTNNARDFIHTAKRLKQLGYGEVNLNLGCPSGTVVAKGKGSGFLAKPEELDRFLEEIFSEQVMKISVKTRIGKDAPEEFFRLIEIFNRYPLEELTIHPRIQKDFYNNKPNLSVFEQAIKLSAHPLCYNGDLHSMKDYQEFTGGYPGIDTVMLGRGLVMNPGLVQEIRDGVKLDKQRLKAFHDEVYAGYQKILFGERNVLFKMKELWFYMAPIFTEHGKYAKKIKKAGKLQEYEEAVNRLFLEQELM
ncbi:MAG TPA: tRNA-dihydrouridine synthase family protein [Clostridiales bacterium]|nr:tRNA-dihydrouridine synthase family protein [Clostridiales bacterium]